MNKKLIVKITLIFSVVFIAVISFFLLKVKDAPTGEIVFGQENFDSVEIKNEDMTKCCTFTNSLGESEGCYVLDGYDCSYCKSLCS